LFRKEYSAREKKQMNKENFHLSTKEIEDGQDSKSKQVSGQDSNILLKAD